MSWEFNKMWIDEDRPFTREDYDRLRARRAGMNQRPNPPALTAVDDLIRMDLRWWEEHRKGLHIDPEDLRFLNDSIVSKLINGRILYLKNSERALAILDKVAQ